MLFIDFSSAFNTIVLSRLADKLIELGLNTPLCAWILDSSGWANTPPDPLPWTQEPLGLRPQPLTVLPVHTWPCGQVQLQHHRQAVVDHQSSSSDESDGAQRSAKATSCTSSDNSDRDRHPRSRHLKKNKANGLRMRQLDYIAKDVERFDWPQRC